MLSDEEAVVYLGPPQDLSPAVILYALSECWTFGCQSTPTQWGNTQPLHYQAPGTDFDSRLPQKCKLGRPAGADTQKASFLICQQKKLHGTRLSCRWLSQAQKPLSQGFGNIIGGIKVTQRRWNCRYHSDQGDEMKNLVFNNNGARRVNGSGTRSKSHFTATFFNTFWWECIQPPITGVVFYATSVEEGQTDRRGSYGWS